MTVTFDPINSRFVATDLPDNLTLNPGELAGATFGLWALNGEDEIEGSLDAEIINGNQGNDILFGFSGNDSLFGGKDNDSINGGAGNDLLIGNEGDDGLFGDIGNDFLRGGKGDDGLFGDAGNDTLIGDVGRDLLVGDTTSDLSGNVGADVFILRTDTAVNDINLADVIYDFGSGDRIGLTGGLSETGLIFETTSLPSPDGIPNTGTVIKVQASGAILGYVLARTPQEITGRFINADGLLG